MEMIRNNRIGSVVSEMKILKISSPFLFLVTATMLVGGRDCRTQFWKGSPTNHSTKVWSQVAKWFQKRIFLVIVYGRTTDAK